MPRNASLSDFVYDDIKRRILTGVYNHEYVFTVNCFAEEFGISPSYVKDALQRLADESYLTCLPRRGYRLNHLFLKDVYDLMDTRCMLETSAAPYVIKNAPKHPQIMKRMYSLIENCNQLMDSTASPEQIEPLRIMDSEFHILYMEMTENNLLLNFYKNLWENSTLHYLYSLTQYSFSIYEGFKNHIRLYNAILNGDTDLLVQEAHSHVEGAINTVNEIAESKNKYVILF